MKTQEKKCKVLNITPHDLKGKHYETVVFMCLRMFFDVVMRNVTTSANENVFHIIKGVQMGDVDVSDELGSNRNRR